MKWWIAQAIAWLGLLGLDVYTQHWNLASYSAVIFLLSLNSAVLTRKLYNAEFQLARVVPSRVDIGRHRREDCTARLEP